MRRTGVILTALLLSVLICGIYVQAASTSACVACHTDAKALEAAKSDGVVATNYLVSEEFLKSVHGRRPCVSCHGGNPDGSGKIAAHQGLNSDPTDGDAGQAACGKCHSKQTRNFEKSFHYTGVGILNILTTRLSKVEDGPQMAKDVFYSEDSCYDCHATCGQCHVSEPTANGGGFLAGHMFVSNTTQEHNDVTCAWCHDTIGPQFMGLHDIGDGQEVKPDIHYTRGMGCADCHSTNAEMHGDGKVYETIGANGKAVACVDCHTNLKGVAHMPKHMDTLTCEACHAGIYGSCKNCHYGDPLEMVNTVKLGMGEDGKIDTFTSLPLGPNMYGDDPVFDMAELETKSTWVQDPPHTIQPVQGTKDFCARCHTNDHSQAGDLFLKYEDLTFPGIEAKYLVPAEKMPKALK